MMARCVMLSWCLLFVVVLAVRTEAAPPAFSLHQHGEGTPDVLIIGGIQGDEPGGFSAATLLTTGYRFTQGSVWVVPNLNFPSIIKRSRGVHGDMNRKFAALPSSDPEYSVVRKIQEYILTPGLKLVLNLHDGSGFYRPSSESKSRNPLRWGQSLIIDMPALSEHPQGNLEGRGLSVLATVNANLLRPEHALHLKNTQTHLGNPEMEKSLSWFAVRNGIPAFGLEASKEFPVEIRTYYHLLMVETLLEQADIQFERTFALTPEGIAKALQSDVQIAFTDRVLLPLENARPRLGGSLSLPRNALDHVRGTKPILTATQSKGEVEVHYGNRTVTRFKPGWYDADTSLTDIHVTIDGQKRRIAFGEIVDVKTAFLVNGIQGYRVNAIGANFGADESNRRLTRKDFQDRFSLDRGSRVYRVEVYRGKQFSGMFLVRFTEAPGKPALAPLPSVAERESSTGGK